MAERPEADYAILRRVVGATLRGLARDQYLFNGVPSRDCDGSLEMRFDGLAVVLFLGRDGGFGRLVGRAVVRVEAVIDAWPEPVGVEVVRGWVVRFAGGDFLAYLNAGDDSRLLLNQLPLHPDPAIRTWIEVVGE